jgi:hypothetical protein
MEKTSPPPTGLCHLRVKNDREKRKRINLKEKARKMEVHKVKVKRQNNCKRGIRA